MQIGIIGSGNIGATVARLFAAAGHSVAISNSRGPETLQGLVAEIGPQVHATTVEEAARFGEVVLLAIPFGKFNTLPADALADKVVVDASNYYPERDGHLHDLDDGRTTSSEMLAAHLRESRIVKAFNTIYYVHLAQQGNTDLPQEERRVIFLSGDDVGAKQVVSGLITNIGFGPVDLGSLRDGGQQQQPGMPIYNQAITVKQALAAL